MVLGTMDVVWDGRVASGDEIDCWKALGTFTSALSIVFGCDSNLFHYHIGCWSSGCLHLQY
jgi:hypothetical protein